MQDKLMADLKTAMLAGERDRVEVLRMIKTAIQMAAIDAKGSMSEEDELKVLAKESKKRKEAAKTYAEAGDEGRASRELAEAEMIDAYLPAQMGEEEVAAIVDEVIASVGNENMGAIMGQVMPKVAGKADGGLVSRLVKERMNS